MVFQWQRRSTLRAVVDSSTKTSVLLKRYGARAVEGECVDIGAGGMRIAITAPQDYPVTQGELLARVQFKFQGQSCSVEAKVCHLGPGIYTQGAVQQLGLAFIHLPAALEDKIIQYTLRYDRECLRRASR
jgi:c-di-GMP-binding flagellar brake protein YcgR